jgi:hypothetical protein
MFSARHEYSSLEVRYDMCALEELILCHVGDITVEVRYDVRFRRTDSMLCGGYYCRSYIRHLRFRRTDAVSCGGYHYRN